MPTLVPTLTQQELDDALPNLAGWSQDGDAIRREYLFPDFAAALRFVNRVAQLAEAADHHPDIDIRYNKVTLALSTHSAGGLTNKDLDLARQINAIS